MELKELFDTQYHIEHLEAKPIYIEMPAMAFSLPFEEDIPIYKFTCALFEDGQLDWLTRQDDIDGIGQAVIDLDRKNEGYFRNMHDDWKLRYTKMMEWHQTQFEVDLSLLEDASLIASLDGMMDAYLKVLRFPPFFDAYMFHADKKLQEMLVDFRKSNRTADNANVLYSILSAPVDDSFLNEMENDLIAIANRKVKGEDIAQAVKDHQKRYSYVNSGYCGYEENPEALIRQKLDELIVGGRLVANAVSQKSKKTKEAMLAKYAFSDEIVRLARLTELLTKWQDERKAVALIYITLDTKYVTEIARRTGLPYDTLVFADHQELKSAIRKELDLRTVEERKIQPFMRVYQEGRVVLSQSGDEVRAFKQKCVQTLKADLKEVRGFTACMGRITGKVRIINVFEDAKQMEEGDVLVISMTRPEHTPFMKRAGAIVTDDGGITCHAAIVAREMGKPCVIGTKVATKVFKDGDMVEVDANHGVVKLIT
jgi:phosphohistidine swiveling domain-containing protein